MASNEQIESKNLRPLNKQTISDFDKIEKLFIFSQIPRYRKSFQQNFDDKKANELVRKSGRRSIFVEICG
jgi:hypothetical protein